MMAHRLYVRFIDDQSDVHYRFFLVNNEHGEVVGYLGSDALKTLQIYAKDAWEHYERWHKPAR